MGPGGARGRPRRRAARRLGRAGDGRRARRQLGRPGAARQEHRRPRDRGRPGRHPGHQRRPAVARLRPPGRRRPVPADPADVHRHGRARGRAVPGPPPRHAARPGRARRAGRVPRGAACGPRPAPRVRRGEAADRRGRPGRPARTSCTPRARPTSSSRRCTGPGSVARPRTVATRCRPARRSGSWAAGQLGRMLAVAARAMGYRIVALDPDPACPAAAVADEVIVGRYDDVDAARRLGERSDVVTYELEHVGLDAAAAAGEHAPLRPGLAALRATQDRLAERRFIREIGEYAAPWREVRGIADAEAAADALGYPCRLKLPLGGYDGRSQARIRERGEVAAAVRSLGGEDGSAAAARGGDRLRVRAVGDPRPRSRRADLRLPAVAQRPRRRDPVRERRARADRPAPGVRRIRDRRAARAQPRPRGPPHGRAVPAPRRRPDDQRARAAGPQLGPLVDRGRGHLPVRAAGPRDPRAAAGLRGAARRGRDGQPAGHRRGSRRAPRRCPGGAPRPRCPPPRLRQAAGVRAAQDGPPDGRRHGRRRGAGTRAAGARARCAGRADST